MKALGAPGSFLLELRGDQGASNAVRAKADSLSFATPIFTEITLAKECGMSLSAYRTLPHKERRLLFFHHILIGKKEEHAYEKSREESERKARMNNPSLKPSFR